MLVFPVLGGLVLLLSLCMFCASGRNSSTKGPLAAPSEEINPAPSAGPGGWRDPEVACGLLRAEGLGGRSYKHSFDEEWLCTSEQMQLSNPNAAGLTNTLSFFAEGTESRVSLLKLYSNVNITSQAAGTQQKMADMAKVLCRRALGVELPATVVAAVSAGRAGTWSVGSAKVTLDRDNWTNGKGSTLRFLIE